MTTSALSSRVLKAITAVAVISSCAFSIGGVVLAEPEPESNKNATYQEVAPKQNVSLEAIEIALIEAKEALEDVEANLQHTPRRIDKASLKAAKKKLVGTIKALEWQQRNTLENHSRLQAIRSGVEKKRVVVAAERLAIEEQVALDIVAHKQELASLRQQVLRELEQTREELAAEIQQLQETIDAYRSDQHAERLRALRKAELAVSEMEQQHLTAIEATEAEIKKAQEALNDKLKKQSALEDKFKLYSRPSGN